ncbi:MAG: RsmE family RNA methyltransferase [Gammaproteobacteria bacterium]|nr:RsmE family RNA methyltransferase [Gammaproteobacteria bacterium]
MIRIYVAGPLDSHTDLTLDADRSHYLTRVLKLRAGDAIVCFDGTGREYAARVADPTPKACTLAVARIVREMHAPGFELHLAQALVKTDLDRVIQKATELGVTDLWFLTTDRTEVRTHPFARWERIAQSAAEQCGRLYLPRLHTTRSVADFLPSAAKSFRKLILTPGAPPLPNSGVAQNTCLLVGPEGGWTANEQEAATEQGFSATGLGALTLRATTAGITAISALRQSWGWIGPEG